MLYSEQEILKAAEIGEVSIIDAEHIISLLFEARLQLSGHSYPLVQCMSCEDVIKQNECVIQCESCYKLGKLA